MASGFAARLAEHARQGLAGGEPEKTETTAALGNFPFVFCLLFLWRAGGGGWKKWLLCIHVVLIPVSCVGGGGAGGWWKIVLFMHLPVVASNANKAWVVQAAP